MKDEDFRFDLEICRQCRFFEKNPAYMVQEPYYCNCLHDSLTTEGSLCAFNTMVFQREDIENEIDPRLRKCPFYLEHLISIHE